MHVHEVYGTVVDVEEELDHELLLLQLAFQSQLHGNLKSCFPRGCPEGVVCRDAGHRDAVKRGRYTVAPGNE